MLPVVLFLHRDPVVHQLVAAALADELQVLSALGIADAQRLAAEHELALIIVDAETADGNADTLVTELRARDATLRAIFFADPRRPDKAWRLADLGTVLPRAHDLDRLRVAVRGQMRQWQLGAAERRRDGQTTKRLPPPSQRADGTSTARVSYFGPAEPGPGEESKPPARRD